MSKRERINYWLNRFNYSETCSKAAEVAFFVTLSIFPFFMFTVSAVAYIPWLQTSGYIQIINEIVPVRARDFIQLIVKAAINNRNMRYLFVSFIMTMWTFSRVIKALVKGMNRAYLSPETRTFIRTTIMSFLFTIMLIILIFMSMILLVYGEKIGHVIFSFIGFDRLFINIWNITRYLIGAISTATFFCLLYKVTPNIKLKIKMVMPGAVFSTLGWFLMSYMYSFYTNNFGSYKAIYGGLEEVIVLLTWIYFSSWVIVLGYRINASIYKRYQRINLLDKEDNKDTD